MIPEQVESGARSDLNQSERKTPRLPGDDSECGQQAGAPANLVGLHVVCRYEAPDFSAAFKAEIPEDRIRIAFDNIRLRGDIGKIGRQMMLRSIQEQKVHRRKKDHGDGF